MKEKRNRACEDITEIVRNVIVVLTSLIAIINIVVEALKCEELIKVTNRNKDIMAIIFNIAVIIICGIGIFYLLSY
ncbi:hypothetical protein CD148_12480 [Staphylococcus delphini]|uniref:Uncharacterized protein n=1 Tax=Staphylococcus delphini TaxID=53344 RepID=A0AAX0QSK3_9STAP|nr:hypothetical protein [Staphylococcus delphini]PCF48223.1 hypothetical protein B5C07_10910 [Staphylococcus delphini]PNZ89157.1 hypothetical protein CD148_12480 [Staphylococcus delphini]RIZ51675.1 hypothetical protein CDL68_09740 [Staphylococcus delphini]